MNSLLAIYSSSFNLSLQHSWQLYLLHLSLLCLVILTNHLLKKRYNTLFSTHSFIQVHSYPLTLVSYRYHYPPHPSAQVHHPPLPSVLPLVLQVLHRFHLQLMVEDWEFLSFQVHSRLGVYFAPLNVVYLSLDWQLEQRVKKTVFHSWCLRSQNLKYIG